MNDELLVSSSSSSSLLGCVCVNCFAVCEYAYSLSQHLDPKDEGRGVLQFKTGLLSIIKVISSILKLGVFLFLFFFPFLNCDLYLSPQFSTLGFPAVDLYLFNSQTWGFFFSNCGSISLQFSTCVFPSVDVCLVIVAFRSP